LNNDITWECIQKAVEYVKKQGWTLHFTPITINKCDFCGQEYLFDILHEHKHRFERALME